MSFRPKRRRSEAEESQQLLDEKTTFNVWLFEVLYHPFSVIASLYSGNESFARSIQILKQREVYVMNCSGHTFSIQSVDLNDDRALFPEVTREIAIRTSETTGMLFRGNSRGRWWYSFRAWDTLYTKDVDYFDISDVPPDTTRAFVIVYGGFQVKISKDCHGNVSVSAESIPGMIG